MNPPNPMSKMPLIHSSSQIASIVVGCAEQPRQSVVKLKKLLFAVVSIFVSGLAVNTLVSAQTPTTPMNATLKQMTAAKNGDTSELRLQMSQLWQGAVPSFLIANPARLVIDLPNVQNETGKSNHDFGVGDLRSAIVGQSGSKTRVIVNLNRNLPYLIATQGDTIKISFTPDLSAASATASGSTSSSNANSIANANGAPKQPVASPTISESSPIVSPDAGPVVVVSTVNKPAVLLAKREVKSIDFRRGDDGAGRLVIDLVEGASPINVRQQGANLILDIEGTNLPDRLRRRLDVTDFATPVQRVSAMMQGTATRMVIEPKGAFEHAAYQTDNRIVIEVRAIKEDPNRVVQGAKVGYKGDRLSLNFQNIEIRNLLQVFADFTSLNIITSDSVTGTITLRLKDVPWDQALDIVMQAKGLDSRKNGNVVLIAPKEELLAKEKLELERQSQLVNLEPVRSEVFPLQYQKAEDLRKMLTEVTSVSSGAGNNATNVSIRFLSNRGSASADVRTNQLFVTDIPGKLEEVKKLLAKIDIPVRQVLIEARIVEASDQFSKSLGVKLGFNDRRSAIYQTVNGVNYPVYGAGSNLGGSGVYGTLSGNQQGSTDLSSQNGAGANSSSGQNIVGLSGGTGLNNTNFFNLPAGAIGGVTPASFALSLFGKSLTRFLNLEISALEADNKGKIISSPRVVTSDSTKAIIQSGTEIPYTTSSDKGTNTVFKKAVLKLEVTPQITPEGNVIMDVEVNKDSRGELVPGAGYVIDTKQIKTQVLVENGGTVVIGGVYLQEESNQTTKVPLLGDLPFFGNLFKSTNRISNRTELLIFITPRVVDSVTNAEAR